jgi:hypothetical protein
MRARRDLLACGLTVVALAQCGEQAADASNASYFDARITRFANLGPLGATGHPLTRALAIPAQEGSGAAEPGGVVVRELDADAPLAAAGLRIGDVIVRAGPGLLPNKEDPTLDLIAGVEDLVSAGLPVELGFWRDGRLAQAVVPLAVAPLERGFPISERFAEGAARAARWLADHELRDGGYSPHEGADRSIALTALVGWSFLAAGGRLDGEHDEQIRSCYDACSAAVSGSAAGTSEWDLALGCCFLAELAGTGSGVAMRALARGIEHLVAAQREDGGWIDSGAAIDTRDLATNLSITALGMAERVGVEVPQDAITRACRFLHVTANTGHVGFAHRAGFDRRFEGGRCAGAAVALWSLGCRPDDAYLTGLVRYQEQIGADIARARRAPALLVLGCAVLARQRGGLAWEAFFQSFRHLLVAAQRRDGSCRWPPGAEATLPFEGVAWNTACLAFALSLQRDAVPVLLGTHSGTARVVRDADGNAVAGDARAPALPGLPEGFDPTKVRVIELKSGEDLQEQLQKLGIDAGQIQTVEQPAPGTKKK